MSSQRRGLALGLTAFILWGLLPLYFKLLDGLPSVEILAQRILWSALAGVLLLAWWKHPGWYAALRRDPRPLLVLLLSGALIGVNWLTYIWAVGHGRMLETSLGYYINPLLSVLLGMLVLGERLRPLQWLAVVLAAVGVVQQIWTVGSLPWVSLVLASTFALYGLVRKRAPVQALPGMVVETCLLLPFAVAALILLPEARSTTPAFWSTSLALLVALSGPVTLVPLLSFNAAARHLPYSTLGFLQYIAPSLVLLQAVLLFGEPFQAERVTTFAFIWAGLALFTVDAVYRLRRSAPV